MKVCMYCGAEVPDSVTFCPACGGNGFRNKCGNCGTVFDSNFCPNCGVKAGAEPKKCPRCGREYYSPACPDCGYMVNGGNTTVIISNTQEEPAPQPVRPVQQPRKQRPLLWALGWLFIFPVPLTILVSRSRKMKPALKYAIIGIAWILYLIFVFTYNSKEDENAVQADAGAPIGTAEAAAQEEASGPEELPLTFVLYENEPGDYGEEVVVYAGTEDEACEIAYHIPAGTYLVSDLNDERSVLVSVYSAGPGPDSEWEYFVTDEDCADPIVLEPGETKELVILEGQFVVLSEGSTNIRFVLQ